MTYACPFRERARRLEAEAHHLVTAVDDQANAALCQRCLLPVRWGDSRRVAGVGAGQLELQLRVQDFSPTRRCGRLASRGEGAAVMAVFSASLSEEDV